MTQGTNCLYLSVDIELNPGPNNGNRIGSHRDANVRAPKRNTYYKTVRTNFRGIMCEHCKLLVHLINSYET